MNMGCKKISHLSIHILDGVLSCAFPGFTIYFLWRWVCCVLWCPVVSIGALIFTFYFLLSLSRQASKEHQPLLSLLPELVLSQDCHLWSSTVSYPSLLIPQWPGIWSQVSGLFSYFCLRFISHFLRVILSEFFRHKDTDKCFSVCTVSTLHCSEDQTDSLGFRCLFLICTYTEVCHVPF